MSSATAGDAGVLARHVLDPLRLPFSGMRLIEASAGTGKTYTLATLFTRLIVEQRLRMGEVLAVTYTEAATQELRKRIRERLALAADLVDTRPRDEERHEVALTRFVIDRHLAAGGETPAQLARRLRTAAEETDLAAIFTIHGFCARVLREHALETGQGFDAGELLAHHARNRRRHLDRDLVGFEAGDRLVERNRFAGLFQPFADRRFGDAFTQGGDFDFGAHLLRSLGLKLWLRLCSWRGGFRREPKGRARRRRAPTVRSGDGSSGRSRAMRRRHGRRSADASP